MQKCVLCFIKRFYVEVCVINTIIIIVIITPKSIGSY